MKFLKGLTIPSLLSTLLKTDGSGNVAAAVANTDYLPVASPTFTGTMVGGGFNGGNIRGSGTVFFTGLEAGGVGFLQIDGNTGQVTQGASPSSFATTSDLNSYATLASPTLTGTPLAPTATAGTNTTQIATTAFVNTSFAKIASPTFTGTVTTPNLTVGTLSGLLKTASGVVSSATANTDYLSAIQGVEVNGRLTLTSGVPITTSDVTSSATIYFTPFNGNTIALWNTSTTAWEVQTFSEQSISLTGLGATPTNYDIFASNNNNGTFTLTATAWTNVSTRATALTLQNGVYVLTGSLGKRYLGTAFISGGVTVDSIAGRWLWNKYNRISRKIECSDSSSSSYTLVGAGGGTWQYCRNNVNTSQCSFVVGQVTENVWISCTNYASIPTGAVYVGTGINISFNSPTTGATMSNGLRIGGQTGALQSGGIINTNYWPTGPGLILLTQLEYAENGTVTFFPNGTTTTSFDRAAITGTVWV